MTPTAEPGTWITTETSAEAMVVRAGVLLLILLVALVASLAARDALRASWRGAGPATRRALGRTTDGGPWACGVCRSVNPAARSTCARCGAIRATSELVFAPVETEPDILPAVIAVPEGSRATLEHNPAAHADGLNGHWRLRVNGVVAGSAARRDGALALLRAIDGAGIVIFDPLGTGLAPYPRDALIAAFERPRLPLGVPCPEHDAAPVPGPVAAPRPGEAP